MCDGSSDEILARKKRGKFKNLFTGEKLTEHFGNSMKLRMHSDNLACSRRLPDRSGGDLARSENHFFRYRASRRWRIESVTAASSGLSSHQKTYTQVAFRKKNSHLLRTVFALLSK